ILAVGEQLAEPVYADLCRYTEVARVEDESHGSHGASSQGLGDSPLPLGDSQEMGTASQQRRLRFQHSGYPQQGCAPSSWVAPESSALATISVRMVSSRALG